MKVVVLSGLGNEALRPCLSSLFETSSRSDFDLHVIRERGFRERTLNCALEVVGVDDDILFVGDDIVFTVGWREALESHLPEADILGMSMLYPGGATVQDRGYDLVQIDDRVVLEAKDRGRSQHAVVTFGSRKCDAVCGCFMFVKKNVFDVLHEFSEEGRNRWGEFIFICHARKHGIKTAVIDHFLYHGGIGTKSNNDKSLSSISYKAERGIWDSIVSKYVKKSFISRSYRTEISQTLMKVLFQAEDILLYGAGSVSEHLIRHLKGKRLTLCSGLAEEQGISCLGYTIEAYEKALNRSYDLIVMTPLHVGRGLFMKNVMPIVKHSRPIVIVIKLHIEDHKYIYDADFITWERCRLTRSDPFGEEHHEAEPHFA